MEALSRAARRPTASRRLAILDSFGPREVLMPHPDPQAEPQADANPHPHPVGPGRRPVRRLAAIATLALAALAPPAADAKPTRSTNIALHPNGGSLVAVNQEANSATIFGVNPDGSLTRRAEVPVGREPHCVAI